jgi:trimethylamine---corrinoid protein Co-methyltransferase
LTHLAIGQLARHYGATFEANSFLGDAKTPSCEIGMQKALTAIPAIMAGTCSLGTLGLLSVDEIASPIQLIIDNEFAGALQRFARGFEVNEDTLAYDLIHEVGPGGLFTGTEHTVKHYRKEHWQPAIFSREMYNSWLTGDHKNDIERAREVYVQIMRSHYNVYIHEDTEKSLVEVIEKATTSLL